MAQVHKLVSLLAVLALLMLPTAASARPADVVNPLSEDQRAQISTFFKENGVSESKSQELLARFERGEVWDSLNPEVGPSSQEREEEGASSGLFSDTPMGLFR